MLENIPKKKCRYCKSRENLTYDHKIPLNRGGTSDLKNIQVLCEGCNQMKSSLTDGEVKRVIKWYTKIKTMNLLEYKRKLYFERDGLTEEVEALDREIANLKQEKIKFPSKVTLHRSLEINDDDYQMDVDTELSLTNQNI